MNKIIYMDNNATTKVDEAVFEEIKPYFTSLYGNPSSMHTFGGQVGKKLEEARERVARLIGAQYTTEGIEEKLREMVSPDIVVHLQRD